MTKSTDDVSTEDRKAFALERIAEGVRSGGEPSGLVMRLLTPAELDVVSGGSVGSYCETTGGGGYTQTGGSFSQGPGGTYTQNGGTYTQNCL